MLDPSRTKGRSDMEDPSETQSSNETMLPSLVSPYNVMDDPSRNSLRKLKEEPTCV